MSDTNRQRERRKPMSTKEARALKIDDRVVIRAASHSDKVGVISKIDWPNFTIALSCRQFAIHYWLKTSQTQSCRWLRKKI